MALIFCGFSHPGRAGLPLSGHLFSDVPKRTDSPRDIRDPGVRVCAWIFAGDFMFTYEVRVTRESGGCLIFATVKASDEEAVTYARGVLDADASFVEAEVWRGFTLVSKV